MVKKTLMKSTDAKNQNDIRYFFKGNTARKIFD